MKVMKFMSKTAHFIPCYFYHIVDNSSTPGGFSIFSKYFKGLNFQYFTLNTQSGVLPWSPPLVPSVPSPTLMPIH